MNILIDNYSNYSSTQSLYLHHHISQMPEHNCTFRNTNMSIYDTMDSMNPDIYITSAQLLSKDFILYMKENTDKDIKLLLNIQTVPNKEVVEVEKILIDNNLKDVMFFSNYGNEAPITRKIKVLKLLDAADQNYIVNKDLNYTIDKMIIVSSPHQIRKYEGTFHVATNNQEVKQDVDFCLPINLIGGLYNRYEEVIFTDMQNNIPQMFFDALFAGKKTYYDLPGHDWPRQVKEMFDEVFGLGDALDYKSTNLLQDFTELQKEVKTKHVSSVRTEELLGAINETF